MNTEEIARNWLEGVWNRREAWRIDELFDTHLSGSSEVATITSAADFKSALYNPMTTAFPDIRLTVDEMIADETRAVIRWTVRATHTGPLGQLPASGKAVVFSGITWLKFRGGKIVEGYDRFNLNGLLNYLTTGATTVTVNAGR